jgi:hypothetical protein
MWKLTQGYGVPIQTCTLLKRETVVPPLLASSSSNTSHVTGPLTTVRIIGNLLFPWGQSEVLKFEPIVISIP